MDQKSSGAFIRKLREDKGLSIADLAEKVGVSVTAVEKWEEGSSFPDEVNLNPLCEILGAKENELRQARPDLTPEEEIQKQKEQNIKSVKAGLITLAVGVAMIAFRIFLLSSENPGPFARSLAALNTGLGISAIVLGLVWFFSGAAGKAEYRR